MIGLQVLASDHTRSFVRSLRITEPHQARETRGQHPKHADGCGVIVLRLREQQPLVEDNARGVRLASVEESFRQRLSLLKW
jgi:hypothetical protein